MQFSSRYRIKAVALYIYLRCPVTFQDTSIEFLYEIQMIDEGVVVNVPQISNTSVVKKLLLSFVVFSLLILAVLGMGLYNFSKTLEAVRWNNHSFEVIQHTESLRSNVTRILLLAQDYSVNPDPALISEAEQELDQFHQHIIALEELTADQVEQRKRAVLIKAEFSEWIETSIAPLWEGTVDTHSEMYVTHNVELMGDIEQALFDFTELEHSLLLERQQILIHSIRVSIVVLITGSFILMVLFAFMTYGGIKNTQKEARAREEAEQTIRDAHESLSGVIEATNVGTWIWDLRTGISEYNDRWVEIVGYTREELGQMPHDLWRSFIHPDDSAEVDRRIQATMDRELEYYEAEFRMRHKDGHWVWIMDRGKIISWSPEGAPLIMSGTHTDISPLKEVEHSLRTSEESYKRLVQQMNQGLVVFSVIPKTDRGEYSFVVESMNDRFAQIMRLPKSRILGQPIREIVSIEVDTLVHRLSTVATTQEPQEFELALDRHNTFLKLSAYVPESGKIAAIVEDVSDAKAMQNRLWTEKSRLETTLMAVGDAVISTDGQGLITVFNTTAERLTGWLQQEALGTAIDHVFHLDQEEIIFRAIREDHSVEASQTALLFRKDGNLIAVEAIASPIFNSMGMADGVVVVFRDSSEKRKRQQLMEKLGYRDALTGLRNRRAFDEEMKRLDRERYLPLVLVIADVNNLKLTNDAFGHDAGDALLKQVSEILVDSCREHDIVARIGGDEFVLLLPKTDAPYVEKIIERMTERLSQRTMNEIPVTVSIGYATKQHEDENISETFREAENTMYRRKISERPQYRKKIVDRLLQSLFAQHPEELRHAELVATYAYELALRSGLSEQEAEETREAGMYHDIGKIALKRELLLEEGVPDEFEGVKVLRHPEVGFNILSAAVQYAVIGEHVLAHHERWDGAGYPSGLKGESIPLQGRILALADYYAIMTTESPAGLGMDPERAIAILQREAGSRLDPTLTKLFIHEVLNMQV